MRWSSCSVFLRQRICFREKIVCNGSHLSRFVSFIVFHDSQMKFVAIFLSCGHLYAIFVWPIFRLTFPNPHMQPTVLNPSLSPNAPSVKLKLFSLNRSLLLMKPNGCPSFETTSPNVSRLLIAAVSLSDSYYLGALLFVLVCFTFWSRFSFYISHDFHVWLLTYFTHCFNWMDFKFFHALSYAI